MTRATSSVDGDRLVPARLRLALVLVLVFHGALLAFGSYRGTYDAYVHIFLGDHYRRDWFSTWDQRWYTGFTTVSYPPGTHMAIAAVSRLVGGLDLAFALIQILILELLTVGVYRFSRLWVNQRAAANAALMLAASSAIAETVHLYGQLPTTFALAFLLNSLPSIRRWVFEGRVIDLIIGTTVLAACTAGHHVTTLFGSIFFLGPVLVHGLLWRSRRESAAPGSDPTLDPPLRWGTVRGVVALRLRRVLPAIVRGAILGPMLLLALFAVVLPYWIWSGSDPITQIPIPHGSRANFLADLNIGLMFFFIPWGLQLLILPYAVVRGIADRMWPLVASIVLLFVLGTGGTTPIPKMLLGGAFDILTLDRFTFWAAIMILPLSGLFVESLETGSINTWLTRTGGRRFAVSAQVGFVASMLLLALFSATLNRYRPFQPDPIDTDPLVAFIEKDQHERWRFLTLGFGDQMAWLSAQTTATQVDGNYHSVRRLPELTSTSVERLEGAKYRGISGLGSLQQFLEVPEKYHLKFVFSNDKFYDPLLHVNGWQRLGPLENGIVIWEKGDIPPLPAVLPTKEIPRWQRLLWGLLPPSMIVAGIFFLGWSVVGRPGMRPQPVTVRVDRRVVRGPIGRIDRFLERRERALPDAGWGQRRGIEDVLLGPGRRLLRRAPNGRRRLVLVVAVVSMLIGWPLRAVALAAPADPVDVVVGYYDDLDFRRFDDAFGRLDPTTRPDYELFRLQLSVNGGVLASFAKLDSYDVRLLSRDGDRAVVRADLRYLTAIDWYPTTVDVDLVLRDRRWYLVPEQADRVIPPDQLVRRRNVDYLIQGKRRVTEATTDLTDIQDRPEVYLRSARLLEVDGLPVIVGELINLDVDPADLTITGVLRDDDGEIVARYNATQHMLHTIRPRESTPFRIEFQQVAAGLNVEFDPLAFSPIAVDDGVASAEVYAKALVTSEQLDRGLGLNNLAVVNDEDDGFVLEGELRNDGVLEATIPMVLVSYLDAASEVVWVDRVFIDEAIRSQRSGSFRLPIRDFSTIEQTDLPLTRFLNGIDPTVGVLGPPPALLSVADLDLPGAADLGIVSVRIDANTFHGSDS